MKRARLPNNNGDKVAALLEKIEEARLSIETLMSGIKEASGKAKDEVQSTTEALEEQAQSLQNEVAMMKTVAGSLDERVVLDVGGVRFTTSRNTLCAKESMLSAMFSGRHKVPVHADG